MDLRSIRLTLARTPEFPEGNSNRGYVFIAPLTKDDHIDVDAWKSVKDKCRVVRFWDGESREGKVRHVGHGWRFDFPGMSKSDEPLFKLEKHVLAPDQYVSITEDDGVRQPFRIVAATRVSGFSS